MKNFRTNQVANTEPAATTDTPNTKVRAIRLSRKAGGVGGMTLNTAALAATAFGQEFIYELKRPLSDEEYAQVMK